MLPKGGVGVGGRSQATFLTLQTRSQVSDFESKEAPQPNLLLPSASITEAGRVAYFGQHRTAGASLFRPSMAWFDFGSGLI